MSTAPVFHISTSKSLNRRRLSVGNRRNSSFGGFGIIPTWTSSALRLPPSFSEFFFRILNGSSKRSSGSIFTGVKPISPVMQCVKMEVDVPPSVAYRCYLDREAIPRWMPFISSVQNLEDKPELSRWSLKYHALGRHIEYSWLALNMQPIPNQKIHWRSMEGVPNRSAIDYIRVLWCTGAVRFYLKGPSSCTIKLTVSYEVPQLLAAVASALQPLLESLLRRGLESFAAFVETY